ncbi:MAG: hypothetical protein ACRENY_01605 [Candidatus Dormibacteria bacterium]
MAPYAPATVMSRRHRGTPQIKIGQGTEEDKRRGDGILDKMHDNGPGEAGLYGLHVQSELDEI